MIKLMVSVLIVSFVVVLAILWALFTTMLFEKVEWSISYMFSEKNVNESVVYFIAALVTLLIFCIVKKGRCLDD